MALCKVWKLQTNPIYVSLFSGKDTFLSQNKSCDNTFDSEKHKTFLAGSGCHISVKIVALLAMRSGYNHYKCKVFRQNVYLFCRFKSKCIGYF